MPLQRTGGHIELCRYVTETLPFDKGFVYLITISMFTDRTRSRHLTLALGYTPKSVWCNDLLDAIPYLGQ
jgi:hypothetical protein